MTNLGMFLIGQMTYKVRRTKYQCLDYKEDIYVKREKRIEEGNNLHLTVELLPLLCISYLLIIAC